MRNVLVTGSTGFLGRHLVRRLRSAPGVRVVELVREARDPRGTEVVCALENLTAEVWSANGIEAFETIFHLGGFTPKSTAQANSVEDIYRSTISGTHALLKSLTRAPETFIYASSVDVYGCPDGVNDEDSPTRPNGFHGAAKLLCEAMVSATAVATGFRSIVLRYGHLYGPGEQAYEKAIPAFIRAVLAGRRPTISANAANAVRDFLFVDDAVEATVRAAARDVATGGPINVVSGEPVSIAYTANLICELAGLALENDPVGEHVRIAPLFDPHRMHETLGTWPLVSLREGLARELAYVKALGET